MGILEKKIIFEGYKMFGLKNLSNLEKNKENKTLSTNNGKKRNPKYQ